MKARAGVDEGEWLTPDPDSFVPGKEDWFLLYRSVWTVLKISPPTSAQNANCPARSESLNRLSDSGYRFNK